MADEKMLLKGKAKQLGIEGYRTMGLEELRVVVANADREPDDFDKLDAGNGATPTKGAVAPQKGKAQVSAAPAKGKAAAKTTTSPAKSEKQKTSPTKGTAAKGTAKRTGVSKGAAARKPAARSKVSGDVKRAPLDVSSIDWDNDTTNVGKDGKRKVVLDSLRRNAKRIAGLKTVELTTDTLYPAVFADVSEHAREWYPNAKNIYPHLTAKEAAEKQLRWLIGRVAFDFAKKSGQHESGSRVWKNPTHPAGGANGATKGRKSAPAKGKTASASKGTRAGAKRKTASRASKDAATPQKPAQAARKPRAKTATAKTATARRPQTPQRKAATATKRVPQRKVLARKGA